MAGGGGGHPKGGGGGAADDPVPAQTSPVVWCCLTKACKSKKAPKNIKIAKLFVIQERI